MIRSIMKMWLICGGIWLMLQGCSGIPTCVTDADCGDPQLKCLTTKKLCYLLGVPGPQGVQGDKGIQGPQGTQGDKGAQGDPGEKGKDGKDATSFSAEMVTFFNDLKNHISFSDDKKKITIANSLILDLTNKKVIVTGANLQIVNGTGKTDSTVTDGKGEGVGNLIIGYNENDGNLNLKRGGSHNLVVGAVHEYSSFGGIVAGKQNAILGEYASAVGGTKNAVAATSKYGSVTGGKFNTVTGEAASISGGSENVASGIAASISGGRTNTASGTASSVAGGLAKEVKGDGTCHPVCQ